MRVKPTGQPLVQPPEHPKLVSPIWITLPDSSLRVSGPPESPCAQRTTRAVSVPPSGTLGRNQLQSQQARRAQPYRAAAGAFGLEADLGLVSRPVEVVAHSCRDDGQAGVLEHGADDANACQRRARFNLFLMTTTDVVHHTYYFFNVQFYF